MRRRLPDLQAAKSRRKSIAGPPGAVLRRMRSVACFRGTAGRFLPIKRAVRDRSAALHGAFARRGVNPPRRPLYLPIGTYLVALEGRRGDPEDRGYMNDFYSRTTGNRS